jgi:hypothetical protein
MSDKKIIALYVLACILSGIAFSVSGAPLSPADRDISQQRQQELLFENQR